MLEMQKIDLQDEKGDGIMTAVNPYLNYDGNAEEAFNFYKSVFGGEFAIVMRFKDNPDCGEIGEADKEKIMHIALPLAGGSVLMASDTLEAFGKKLVVGNNLHIALAPDSREEADRLFAGLSEGGKVEMPMTELFFGYFGSFTDKFGVGWLVNHGPNKE
jgi:PhnB protein